MTKILLKVSSPTLVISKFYVYWLLAYYSSGSSKKKNQSTEFEQVEPLDLSRKTKKTGSMQFHKSIFKNNYISPTSLNQHELLINIDLDLEWANFLDNWPFIFRTYVQSITSTFAYTHPDQKRTPVTNSYNRHIFICDPPQSPICGRTSSTQPQKATPCLYDITRGVWRCPNRFMFGNESKYKRESNTDPRSEISGRFEKLSRARQENSFRHDLC